MDIYKKKTGQRKAQHPRNKNRTKESTAWIFIKTGQRKAQYGYL